MEKQSVDHLIDYATASGKALADLLLLHAETKVERDRSKALLHKIYLRAMPSLFDDAGETRLDSDLMDEIETLLNIEK